MERGASCMSTPVMLKLHVDRLTGVFRHTSDQGPCQLNNTNAACLVVEAGNCRPVKSLEKNLRSELILPSCTPHLWQLLSLAAKVVRLQPLSPTSSTHISGITVRLEYQHTIYVYSASTLFTKIASLLINCTCHASCVGTVVCMRACGMRLASGIADTCSCSSSPARIMFPPPCCLYFKTAIC